MPKQQSIKPNTKEQSDEKPERSQVPAILFDLDGTLLDSAYEHVMAWHEALEEEGVAISSVRVHRCVGMSSKLMLRTLFTEIGLKGSSREIEHLEKLHKRNFEKRLPSIRMLPGARELLRHLSGLGVRWAIATSGDQKTVDRMIKPLRVPSAVPVITGDHVKRAKPNPDVFLAAATCLGVALCDCIVVGDSVWDLLAAGRAKALGIGMLCGGYGEAELVQAGAYRVYKNPADLLEHIAEIGIQSE
jgi:HAD superfamily hydrolase (TIGR01509 family)